VGSLGEQERLPVDDIRHHAVAVAALRHENSIKTVLPRETGDFKLTIFFVTLHVRDRLRLDTIIIMFSQLAVAV
jgi:hypothetical protein